MSRFTDALPKPRGGEPPPIPVVDWARISQAAPTHVEIQYRGPTAPLPNADVVVLTWTSAEWSALDQVFLDSSTARARDSREFERAWHPYLFSAGVGGEQSPNAENALWGYFRIVDVAVAANETRTVLLFKCDAHLAHPPWLAGLVEMIKQILTDTQASWLYSIGTAGGAQLDAHLGDVMVTNSADLSLRHAVNEKSGLNGKSFTCSKPLPPDALITAVKEQLFFRMANAVSYPVLERLLAKIQRHDPAARTITLSDLVNEPLRPENLSSSSVNMLPDKPLFTTDYYYIAPDPEAWVALEMDDAVVASAAEGFDIGYAFVRNISDSLVPGATAAGHALPAQVREDWSSAVYEEFGLYTSFNGALATWALIAGM